MLKVWKLRQMGKVDKIMDPVVLTYMGNLSSKKNNYITHSLLNTLTSVNGLLCRGHSKGMLSPNISYLQTRVCKELEVLEDYLTHDINKSTNYEQAGKYILGQIGKVREGLYEIIAHENPFGNEIYNKTFKKDAKLLMTTARNIRKITRNPTFFDRIISLDPKYMVISHGLARKPVNELDEILSEVVPEGMTRVLMRHEIASNPINVAQYQH